MSLDLSIAGIERWILFYIALHVALFHRAIPYKYIIIIFSRRSLEGQRGPALWRDLFERASSAPLLALRTSTSYMDIKSIRIYRHTNLSLYIAMLKNRQPTGKTECHAVSALFSSVLNDGIKSLECI